MNTGADAADQIVRMTLNGVEVAAKITGTGAKELAVLLYAVLKDQKKTKGKTRLTNMLKSGKELRVFAVKDKDLERFCREAKKYGVLYCVLKDKNSKDGLTDVMVRAEDASKINRIFERFQLATVDVGQIQQELERLYGQQAAQPDHRTEEGATQLLNELLKKPDRENPPPARTAAPHPSGPSSVSREAGDPLDGTDPFPRQSIRKELKQIREAQRTGQKTPRRRDPRNQSGHRPPQRSVRKPKRMER